MATKFSDNISLTTKTDYIGEVISITGSVLSGTYPEPGLAGSNVKQPDSEMYQSIYDYPHLSQSANQILDITWGVRTGGQFAAHVVTGTTTDTQAKFNVYDQMAALILGYDQAGSVRVFDVSASFNSVNAASVMDAPIFIHFSRLVNKDELRKGSFKLKLSKNQYSEPEVFASAAATATITCVSATSSSYNGKKLTIISTDNTSVVYKFDTGGTNPTGTNVGGEIIVQIASKGTAVLIAAELEAAIEGATGHNGKITVSTGASMTLTQTVAGNNGNTVIDKGTFTDAILTKTNFTGGGSALIEITDSGSSDYENGLRILKETTNNTNVGILDRYRGIAVIQLSSSVVTSMFNDASGLNNNYFVSASATRAWNISGSIHSGTIDELATGFRHRIYNLEVSNLTQLNNAVYTITIGNSEFNYSSNPSYIDSTGQIRVRKENGVLNANLQPYAYITGIGLYGADDELLAVAKFSKPVKKSEADAKIYSVKLTY